MITCRSAAFPFPSLFRRASWLHHVSFTNNGVQNPGPMLWLDLILNHQTGLIVQSGSSA